MKWILVIGCNCFVFEMGNGAFAGQMDLNANAHYFLLHFNLKPVSHSHGPLVWTGKIISNFLSLSKKLPSLWRGRERESDIGRQLVLKVSIILICHGVFHRPFLIWAACTCMHVWMNERSFSITHSHTFSIHLSCLTALSGLRQIGQI